MAKWRVGALIVAIVGLSICIASTCYAAKYYRATVGEISFKLGVESSPRNAEITRVRVTSRYVTLYNGSRKLARLYASGPSLEKRRILREIADAADGMRLRGMRSRDRLGERLLSLATSTAERVIDELAPVVAPQDPPGAHAQEQASSSAQTEVESLPPFDPVMAQLEQAARDAANAARHAQDVPVDQMAANAILPFGPARGQLEQAARDAASAARYAQEVRIEDVRNSMRSRGLVALIGFIDDPAYVEALAVVSEEYGVDLLEAARLKALIWIDNPGLVENPNNQAEYAMPGYLPADDPARAADPHGNAYDAMSKAAEQASEMCDNAPIKRISSNLDSGVYRENASGSQAEAAFHATRPLAAFREDGEDLHLKLQGMWIGSGRDAAGMGRGGYAI